VFGDQSAAAGASGLGGNEAPGGSSTEDANPTADTATSTTPSDDASIEGAGHQDNHAEEDEDHDGGQPQDGSDPGVQSTAPEPEETATPVEVVTIPAILNQRAINDNEPAVEEPRDEGPDTLEEVPELELDASNVS
jgi:hypothetical protein